MRLVGVKWKDMNQFNNIGVKMMKILSVRMYLNSSSQSSYSCATAAAVAGMRKFNLRQFNSVENECVHATGFFKLFKLF